jgi:D-alanyl-D-alanine carboxypeptidase (penicillin-binding protein 5/6)
VSRRRPTLYALEQRTRPPRGERLPRLGILRAAAALVVVVGLAAGAAAVWRVWPLVQEPAAAVRLPEPPATPAEGLPHRDSPPDVPDGVWGPRIEHARIPGVTAPAAAVVDGVTGEVLWGRRPHRRLPVASLTKMMTTLLVTEERRLGRRFRVAASATTLGGSGIGLRAGQRVSVRRMLAAAIIESANDAATALAVQRAGSVSAFVRLMNRRAGQWQLRDTRFSNPSGLVSRGNRSSAWDVADLARRVLAQPFLARLAGLRVYRTGRSGQYVSHNDLLWTFPGAIGVKTGFTYEAGYCVAAAARRGRRVVIAVVLGGRREVFRQAERLLLWGFRHPPR